MMEKLAESSGNIVGYKAVGKITASDYKKLEPEVMALVEKEGNIRLMFDLTNFKMEKIETWLADLKFGHEFHNQIEKIAIVGDKIWEKWMTHLAKLFCVRDVKFFHSADNRQGLGLA